MAEHSSALHLLMFACLITTGFSLAQHRCFSRYAPHNPIPNSYVHDPSGWFNFFGRSNINPSYLPMQSLGNTDIYRRNMSCTVHITNPPTKCMYAELMLVKTQGTYGSCNPDNINDDVLQITAAGGSRFFCGYQSSSNDWPSMHLYTAAGQDIWLTFNSNNQVPVASAEAGYAGYAYIFDCAPGSRRRRRAVKAKFTDNEGTMEKNKNSEGSTKQHPIDVNKELQRMMSPEDYENVKMIREKKLPQRHTSEYHALCDRSCHTRRLVNFYDCCHYWYYNRITPEPCNEPAWGISGWYIPECPKELQLPKQQQSTARQGKPSDEL